MDVVAEGEYRGLSCKLHEWLFYQKPHIIISSIYKIEGKFDSNNNIKSYYCNYEEWKSQHGMLGYFYLYQKHTFSAINNFCMGLYIRSRMQIKTNIPIAVHTSVILYIQGMGMITFMTDYNLLWEFLSNLHCILRIQHATAVLEGSLWKHLNTLLDTPLYSCGLI